MSKFEYFLKKSIEKSKILIRFNKQNGVVERYVMQFGWIKDMTWAPAVVGLASLAEDVITEEEANQYITENEKNR